MTIEEFKNYARIDYNDDDEFIQSLIEASKKYIEESTGKTLDENNSLHTLLLKILTLHFYENRQAITSNSVNEVPYTITNLLTHISMSGGNEL
jgi:uncharacterized phage protein (predicted DNA packaging)